MAEAATLNKIEIALQRALASLGDLKARFALVGGLAVSARIEPRFTRDVDLAVAVADDDGAEQLVSALRGRGYTPMAMLEHESTGRIATVRLIPTSGGAEPDVVVDLLFASSGIEPELVHAAELLPVAGTLVPVARRGHLVAMKLLSRSDRRPQDSIDLRGLLRGIDQPDLDLAREAAALIVARGFHRGRDLPAELIKALADANT